MSLPVLNSPEHESKCRRCGVSCHMALEVGHAKYVMDEIRCRFLVKEAEGQYACSVYEKRFEMAPWCHTAEEAAQGGHLSTGCLYAAHLPHYKGREWAGPEVRQKLLPIIRKKLIAEGLPLSCNPDAALPALNSTGEHWAYSEQKDKFLFHRKP